jgi:hypothetical protein
VGTGKKPQGIGEPLEDSSRQKRLQDLADTAAAWLGKLKENLNSDPAAISARIVTHLPKVPSTSAEADTAILDPRSVNFDPNYRAGVASPSVRSDVSLGMTGTGAATVALDASLALPEFRSGCFRASRLSAALSRDVSGLTASGLDEKEAEDLIGMLGNLGPKEPDRVDGHLHEVYFEADGEEVLVTPLLSAKIIAELNRRLFPFFDPVGDQAADLEPSVDAEFLPVSSVADSQAGGAGARKNLWRFRHKLLTGGTKPQNAGYAAHKNWNGALFGAIANFSVLPPRRNDTAPAVLLRKLIATGSFESLTQFSHSDLRLFFDRSRADIDLGSHRDVESAQAETLVEAYLEPARSLWPIIGQFLIQDQGEFWNTDPYSRVAKIERALIDPGMEDVDLNAISRHVAGAISRRILKAVSTVSTDPLSDRSNGALLEAAIRLIGKHRFALKSAAAALRLEGAEA